jgi:hypothetical protein
MRRTQQQIAREAKATVVPATRYGVESLKRLGILGLILAASAAADAVRAGENRRSVRA